MLGTAALDALARTKGAVFGLGGVGGWCATTAAQGERRTLGVTVEGGILQFKHGAGFFSLG